MKKENKNFTSGMWFGAIITFILMLWLQKYFPLP